MKIVEHLMDDGTTALISRKDITGKLLRTCFGAIHKKSTPSKVLDWTLDEMASAQRDADKTGDADSLMYYNGMIDAFNMVAHWLAPAKDEKTSLFNQLLGFIDTQDDKAA